MSSNLVPLETYLDLPAHARLLGLDLGTKTIGLALSDVERRIASPLETHFIDELTSIVAILLTGSCMFSFVSIRTKSPDRERKLETIADYLFFTALIGILVSIIIIAITFFG